MWQSNNTLGWPRGSARADQVRRQRARELRPLAISIPPPHPRHVLGQAPASAAASRTRGRRAHLAAAPPPFNSRRRRRPVAHAAAPTRSPQLFGVLKPAPAAAWAPTGRPCNPPVPVVQGYRPLPARQRRHSQGPSPPGVQPTYSAAAARCSYRLPPHASINARVVQPSCIPVLGPSSSAAATRPPCAPLCSSSACACWPPRRPPPSECSCRVPRCRARLPPHDCPGAKGACRVRVRGFAVRRTAALPKAPCRVRRHLAASTAR